MEFLHAIDLYFLHLINVDHANPEMDQVWLTVTHLDRHYWFSFVVLPLILFGLFSIYKWSALRLLIALTIAVGITDMISYRLIKAAVERPRPFQNVAIASWVRQVDDAHGSSFPSNHAANCFAGAVVLAWYFRSRRYYFYAFATIVAVSRVALGVHYPSDVIGGALVGGAVGYLVIILLLQRDPRFRLVQPESTSDNGNDEWRPRSRRLPKS